MEVKVQAIHFDATAKLNEFIELYEARLAQECEIYYKKGFRFAYRLMVECFNDKF